MVRYYYKKDTFVIEDFQKAKTFASFLPAVAGVDGKPLWAFYANVGQAMGGFGVDSKETPITPFDSANLAYQNIPIKSFRTFLKIDNEVYSPFFNHDDVKQTMYINKSSVRIVEESKLYRMEVVYSTVPRRSYAGLIRKVTYTNLSSSKKEFFITDGLPVFFPHGLSNFCYKELVSLMAAYCVVTNIDKNAPYVKFKTSTGDNSIVQEATTGNGFVTIDQANKRLFPIVDPYTVFKDDLTILHAQNIEELDYDQLIKYDQQTENKLPCAFTTFKRVLNSQETYTTYSVYGKFETVEQFNDNIDGLTPNIIDNMIEESEKIIDNLLAPASTKTNYPFFDMYMKQSLLDNSLRGGFPVLLDNGNGGEVYYVFSRKHGDMERDYNSFQIPSRYYSSGCGNFRDVNQNRRNDLYFFPFVKDYNIKIFFSLIQVDGQNPLNVKPLTFVEKEDTNHEILSVLTPALREKVEAIIKRFEPSELYTLLKDNAKEINEDVDVVFAKILGQSRQEVEANFAEGYWVDHWTYNVDLLENYASIYPDQMEELLFKEDYKYFYSLVYVNPRKEKYSLLPNGEIRQYGAIDLKALKEECDKLNFDIKKTHWLKDESKNEIKTTLASKITNLILIKFSTLDNQGLGIEMECEKPGWNDAMNGLPGLFASGMSESVELLRLVNFAIKSFDSFKDRSIELLEEQYDFLVEINSLLDKRICGQLSSFEYWDKATSARETFRERVHYGVKGSKNRVKISFLLDLFNRMKKTLEEGIKKARVLGDGIIPSYLIYKVSDYDLLGRVNHLGFQTVRAKKFDLIKLPPFLEASARALKLGKEVVKQEDYQKIKESDMYDKTLKFYKTCANIDDAPFEIGRVHAFTKGWLERECNFLHMTYKYMLGLLKAGYYERFYEEIKNNLVIFMKPEVYGRSIIENSSFIVPTCNPDKKNHGRGFFARLTGANAELIDMFATMFIGDNLFEMKDGELELTLSPKLAGEFFDDNNEASFKLFSKIDVVYHNPSRKDCYKGVSLRYLINGVEYKTIKGKIAQDIRDLKVARIDVEID